MSEWNRMEDFKNGMEDNLPFFHTRFRSWYLQKNTYGCWVVTNNIHTEVLRFCFDILWCFGCVYCANRTYCITVSTLQLAAFDAIADGFGRLDMFFRFGVDNLPSCEFCFFHRHKNSYLVLIISFPFELNVFCFLFSL